MKYEEFKKEVVSKLGDYLPTPYNLYEIKVSIVPKVNGFMECINILDPNKSEPSPNIYIDMLYEEYLNSNDIDKVVRYAVDFFIDSLAYARELSSRISCVTKNDNIVMVLINTSMNKELLKNIPHRNIMDLSVIYRWVIDSEEGKMNSAIITNHIMDNMKINEEGLFQLAFKNTNRIFPVTTNYMAEEFCVLTNSSGINGAASMLYTDELDAIATKHNSDLFVLPSSIHEVIVIPTIVGNLNQLRQTVCEANSTVVDDKDLLSNNVYCFIKEKSQLVIAN